MTKTSEVTALNRIAWDASARHHETGSYWNDLTTGFVDKSFSCLDPVMTDALLAADIEGARAVQIGCNNDREALSACALGASMVWGIDQSREFLKQAETLRAISGHPARFVMADIYDLPESTPNDFDVAFITIGVLGWMPDIPQFFRAVARLLRPGGRLIIYETHPILEIFDPQADDPFRPAFSYFRAEAFVETGAITYDGSVHSDAPESHWFVHTLGTIVQGCIDAGLTLTRLQEFPHSNREVDYGIYANQPAQVPMSYLLSAAKK